MVHILRLVWWKGKSSSLPLFSLIVEFFLTSSGINNRPQAQLQVSWLPSPSLSSTLASDVGHGPAFSAMLTSFSRMFPGRLRVLPQWDLSLVLMALTRAPFKPLQVTTPRLLAWKVSSSLCISQGPEGVNSSTTHHRGRLSATAGFPSPPSTPGQDLLEDFSLVWPEPSRSSYAFGVDQEAHPPCLQDCRGGGPATDECQDS